MLGARAPTRTCACAGQRILYLWVRHAQTLLGAMFPNAAPSHGSPQEGDGWVMPEPSPQEGDGWVMPEPDRPGPAGQGCALHAAHRWLSHAQQSTTWGRWQEQRAGTRALDLKHTYVEERSFQRPDRVGMVANPWLPVCAHCVHIYRRVSFQVPQYANRHAGGHALMERACG